MKRNDITVSSLQTSNEQQKRTVAAHFCCDVSVKARCRLGIIIWGKSVEIACFYETLQYQLLVQWWSAKASIIKGTYNYCLASFLWFFPRLKCHMLSLDTVHLGYSRNIWNGLKFDCSNTFGRRLLMLCSHM